MVSNTSTTSVVLYDYAGNANRISAFPNNSGSRTDNIPIVNFEWQQSDGFCMRFGSTTQNYSYIIISRMTIYADF